MKVNSPTQQSFKGLYIIKGTGRDVITATNMISKKCSSPAVQEFIKDAYAHSGIRYKINTVPDFLDLSYHTLTEILDHKQPLTQNLIATNEDAIIIDDYNSQPLLDEYENDLGYTPREEKMSIQIRLAKEFNSFFNKVMKYKAAEEECLKRGNTSLLADFVLKQAIQAKKTLKEIIDKYEITQNIKVLEAKNVINAIEQNCFDCINGNFKSI